LEGGVEGWVEVVWRLLSSRGGGKMDWRRDWSVWEWIWETQALRRRRLARVRYSGRKFFIS